MRLILVTDVKSLGKKGDVVDVAEGYGRNFLVPRKLATEARKARSPSSARSKMHSENATHKCLPTRKRSPTGWNRRRWLSRRKPAATKSSLCTNADVATAIAETLAVAIDKHKIELKSTIKALGSYPVEIKLHKNVVAKATVDVVAT